MMEQRIREIINKNGFSGTILVTHETQDVIAIASGEADRANHRMNQLDTSYQIASGTKGFTAMAILKLIDTNRLRLEDTINALLDEFKDYPYQVSIENLLTHTSGIPDYCDEEKMDLEDFKNLFMTNPVYTLGSPSDFFKMFIHESPDFKPGEKFKYNNSAFIVLARVVEVVTGKAFKEFVKEEVIDVLGLKGTGFYYLNNLPANCANAYLEDGSTNIYAVPFIGGGDGGMFTTVYDMKDYWLKTYKGEFLSEDLRKKVFSPLVEEEAPDYHYGLGHYVTCDKGEMSKIMLVGGDPGVAFYSYYDVKRDLVLTMIGNDESTLWSIRKSIVDLIESYF